MINILSLIASFGGGVFAASVGGLESFIITGIFAIAGSIAGMCGAADASGFLLGHIAFGPFFGPYVAFAGAVAAASYAKKKGVLDNGADIVTALSGLNEPDVLVVGGVFGVIGYLFKTLVADNLFGGGISPRLVTDTPGITVFCSAIVVRLLFGGSLKTGVKNISEGKALSTTILIGLAYSVVVGGVYVGAISAGVPLEAMAGYNVLIFGMAAVGLVFIPMGLSFFGCHHIVIIAALAVMKAYASTGNLYIALIVSIVFGTLSTLIGDIAGNAINSGTDSHIDPPATAIFIMTFVTCACFG